MNKSLSLILLSFWLTTLAANATDVPVWELEGTHNRFLLLGSIHFLRASDYPLPPAFDEAYAAADALLMELDMDNMDTVNSMTVIESLSKDPQGRTLREQIGAARYQQVITRAEMLGINTLLLDDKEAWYAAIVVSQIRLMQMGFDPSWGIETHFTAMAMADGKPIDGLETLADQLGVLDRMSIDTQAEFLLESLNDQATAEAEMQSMVTAWKSGDSEALAQTMLEGIGDIPELYSELIVKRNINWANQIEQLDKSNRGKTYLVIVGGMHLVGPDSVQHQLKSKGISYRQLAD